MHFLWNISHSISQRCTTLKSFVGKYPLRRWGYKSKCPFLLFLAEIQFRFYFWSSSTLATCLFMRYWSTFWILVFLQLSFRNLSNLRVWVKRINLHSAVLFSLTSVKPLFLRHLEWHFYHNCFLTLCWCISLISMLL